MATYEREYEDDAPDMLMNFSLTERAIYGSSRVANNTEEVLLVSQTIGSTSTTTNYFDNPEILSHTNGYKHFELTNHASTPLSTGLCNVMAVVSDKRTPVITGSEITGYTPELLIAKDYYPFGMEMSGRYDVDLGTEPDDEYRFGFQNQEKDDEWTGQTGSHLNFKYRMYDARIGRFFAIDPLASKYPYNSTYAFSENRVIDRIELEGLETAQIPSNCQPFSDDFEPESGSSPIDNEVLEDIETISTWVSVGGDVITAAGIVFKNPTMLVVGKAISISGGVVSLGSNIVQGDLGGTIVDAGSMALTFTAVRSGIKILAKETKYINKAGVTIMMEEGAKTTFELGLDYTIIKPGSEIIETNIERSNNKSQSSTEVKTKNQNQNKEKPSTIGVKGNKLLATTKKSLQIK